MPHYRPGRVSKRERPRERKAAAEAAAVGYIPVAEVFYALSSAELVLCVWQCGRNGHVPRPPPKHQPSLASSTARLPGTYHTWSTWYLVYRPYYHCCSSSIAVRMVHARALSLEPSVVHARAPVALFYVHARKTRPKAWCGLYVRAYSQAGMPRRCEADAP